MAKAVKMLLNEHILGCSLSNSELGKLGKSLRVYIMDGKGLVVCKMSGRCKVNAPAFKRMTVFVSKLTDAVMFQDFWWLFLVFRLQSHELPAAINFPPKESSFKSHNSEF